MLDIEGTEEKPYASFWWRLLALIIDSIILSVPSFILGMAIGIVMAILFASGGEDAANAATSLASLLAQLVGMVLSWLYYALMESSAMQATIGKKICGLTVTDLNGERLSFARATGRFFSRIVSGIPCAIGYLFPLFTQKKQALHDMLAGTLVLRKG